MRLLIDANILLDVLQNREPFVHDSSIVWKLCETEQAKGYVSALTIANMVYIMRKELNPEQVESVLKALSLIFEFVDLKGMDLAKAAGMKCNDFEDALQSATAERLGVDLIITRNVRDFTESKVISLTPTELISRL